MQFIKRLGCSLLLLMLVSPLQGADLILPDLDGKDRSLAEFNGKWVVVNFWATWCPPCIDEMPELELFHEKHKDQDAVVLGINMEDITLDRLKIFVEEMFINYPILLAPSDGRTTLGRIPALPTTLLISPKGELVAKHIGSVSAVMIEKMIEQQTNAQ